MTMFTENQNLGKLHLDVPNLKVLEDQLNYESIMAKKLGQYANYCTDPELKNVCQQGAQRHKQNFHALLDYLNAHQ